jgi:uncharacterized protein
MVTRALPTDPGLVLFGATRRRLLAWLFGHPDEAFYLRELLRQTGAPEGGAQRELAALTAAGILSRTERGRQVYFQANRDSLVFPELLSLLTKTTGAVDVLREALEPLAPRVAAAFVYGSAARNELRQGSDIDLMVVGDVEFADVAPVLRGAEAKLGREVNATVYPLSEFQAKIRDGHHFLTAVLRAPYLLVIGSRDDVERLARAKQMAGDSRDDTARDRRTLRGGRSRSARQPRRGPQR